MNIRYDVANYHRATDEEKNIFWLKEINRPLEKISFHSRVKMDHTSRLVEIYINASEEEQQVLWKLYDNFSQLYCDNEQWHQKLLYGRK